ncbi:hypothetical protein Tco_0974964 [Tanacetum coccineum]|uniref:Uncharacterized protein n=1 Tax=Tanacetum coccineum TaxID=301880 RepID=A0ABQ5EE85_9ASTR
MHFIKKSPGVLEVTPEMGINKTTSQLHELKTDIRGTKDENPAKNGQIEHGLRSGFLPNDNPGRRIVPMWDEDSSRVGRVEVVEELLEKEMLVSSSNHWLMVMWMSFRNGSSSGCHAGLWWLIENEEDDEMVVNIWREFIRRERFGNGMDLN